MFGFTILRPYRAYSTFIRYRNFELNINNDIIFNSLNQNYSSRFYSPLVCGNVGSVVSSYFNINKIGLQNMQVVRFMNRNARRPKKV